MAKNKVGLRSALHRQLTLFDDICMTARNKPRVGVYGDIAVDSLGSGLLIDTRRLDRLIVTIQMIIGLL